jgi:glycopeptide antibiotics resistance protein
LATGVTTFKSGLYPLPHPRHTSWGFLSVFIIAIPLLLLIAAWRARLPASLRYYLTFSVALVLVLFPFMSGIISVSHPGKGTFQRLFAIANFIPVGITAYALRTRQ